LASSQGDGQGEVFVHVAETLFEGDKLTLEVQSIKKGLQGSPTARFRAELKTISTGEMEELLDGF
jgi:hypothetical protein